MQSIGRGSIGGTDAQIEQFGRLYWYTIEFGVVRQAGKLKAYGAGLLSSSGELERAINETPEIRRLDTEQARHMPNPITTYQPLLWEVCSIREAFLLVGAAIERIKHEA